MRLYKSAVGDVAGVVVSMTENSILRLANCMPFKLTFLHRQNNVKMLLFTEDPVEMPRQWQEFICSKIRNIRGAKRFSPVGVIIAITGTSATIK